jgi:WD repeat-containing protein 23
LIYSSWSDYVHICNIHGDFEIHDALDFRPGTERFCLFSIKFSPDSNEILGGSSDRHLYIYDLNRKERIVRIEAHEDDINTVCFLDSTGNLIISASDDQMVKVWDR